MQGCLPHPLPPPLRSYVTMRGADVMGTSVGSAVSCLSVSLCSWLAHLPALSSARAACRPRLLFKNNSSLSRRPGLLPGCPGAALIPAAQNFTSFDSGPSAGVGLVLLWPLLTVKEEGQVDVLGPNKSRFHASAPDRQSTGTCPWFQLACFLLVSLKYLLPCLK